MTIKHTAKHDDTPKHEDTVPVIPVSVKETKMPEVFSVQVLKNIESLHEKADATLAVVRSISETVSKNLPVVYPSPPADASLLPLQELGKRVVAIEAKLDHLGAAVEEAVKKLGQLVAV